jgi:hypothetical protein
MNNLCYFPIKVRFNEPYECWMDKANFDICICIRFVPKAIYEQKSEKNTLEIQENCRNHEYVKGRGGEGGGGGGGGGGGRGRDC